MAYAGRSKEELLENYIPKIIDTSISLKESAYAALTLGLTFVGQCRGHRADLVRKIN